MGRILSCKVISLEESNQAMRLDAYLAERGFYDSRSAAARAIDKDKVFINGKRGQKNMRVHEGDLIVYELDDALPAYSMEPEDIPLNVLFEDENLLVISKQIGLVCHPSPDHPRGTLVNALVHHCGAENLCCVQGGEDRLGIVHRLDQDTSGLMLAAKTNESGYALMEAISNKVVDRRYLALVHGIIPGETGMVDAPIARSDKDRKRMTVRDGTGSRDALTTFRVLERFEASPSDDGYTLIDCKLFTGRTHQIRVHMEFAKHPLVGEGVYCVSAPKAAKASLGLNRQFLHSFQLSFEHPVTGESLSFSDSLPEDLHLVLAGLAERSTGKTAAGEALNSLY